MILLLLIAVPGLCGLGSFFIRTDSLRRAMLIGSAGAHAALVALCWAALPPARLHGWIALDALGLLFLSITSGLFLMISFYAVGYLRRERGTPRTDEDESTLLVNEPEAVFTGCLLLFLATMSLVTMSAHFGLLWVAIEATTLSSAPLIYFHRHPTSLEATWKYLLVCSVGIALALLGNFFIAIAFTAGGKPDTPLLLGAMQANAASLHVQWFKAAFVLLLVGYGTKMGLAPLHTWLPDAHSEAPSLVSALLSGALLNCAFLGILRAFQVCLAAGQPEFARHLLAGFGLFSMAVAAAFILGQTDYKRMLAYSSVEHMGVLALGVGMGGAAVYGSLLHAVNHSLAKGMLFLSAGNILAAFRTRRSAKVQGALRVLPVSGALWLAGFFAITGTPPFGVFLSKFIILKAALDGGHVAVVVTALALFVVIFVGMLSVVLRMAQGAPPQEQTVVKESVLTALPPVLLGLAVLSLGLVIPANLSRLLSAAAALVGGQP